MAGEWREMTLGDLFKVKHGFAFKGQFFTDEPQPEILVTPGNYAIGGGFQADKRKYYSGPVPTDYVLQPGQIVVTMTDLSKQSDTLGFAAKVPSDTNVWLHNQRVGLLVFNPSGEADARFVEYLLRSHEYRTWIVGSATGTTVKHTSPTRIECFRTLIPPLAEQRAIAHILGTLDDKIELNRRRNQTLESLARALFKDWFVDFGPVRAKMEGRDPYLPPDLWNLFPDRLDDVKPARWETKRVSDYLSLAYGKSLPAKTRLPGGVPVYGSGGVTGLHNEALINGPAVIVGRKGTVGSLFWDDRACYPIDTVFFVQPKAPLTFCYYLLESLPLRSMNTDAAVPGLNRENVYRLEVSAPPDELISAFSQTAFRFRDRIAAISKENENLAQLRDTLLPKLISGDIRIREAERLAGTMV